MKTLNPEWFHHHYQMQAEWLSESRYVLFRKVGLARFAKILDFGCGTGIITNELKKKTMAAVTGIDRDPSLLAFARSAFPNCHFIQGDERFLIARKEKFDLVLMSFVILWQKDPLPFLKRIKKILSSSGTLLVLAEPDYGGRLDFPAELAQVKDLYINHIRENGGDPFIGRQIKSLLSRAGFQSEVGTLNPLHFINQLVKKDWEKEWQFWERLTHTPRRTIRAFQRAELQAIHQGTRMVYFPIFYAVAVPDSTPLRRKAAWR